jgi:protein SCO1/2
VLGLLVVVALLAACAQAPERAATLDAMNADDDSSVAGMHGQPVAEPYRKPDVQLVDTRGVPFTIAHDATRPVVLVFFGYTRCLELCSTVLADLAAALRPLDPGTRQRIEVLFVSIDPQRDTPQVLRTYLDRFDPTFVGLTGTDTEVAAVARALGVPLTGREPVRDGYTIGHGVQVIGFGRDGLARIIWMPGTEVGDLRADVVRLASDA